MISEGLHLIALALGLFDACMCQSQLQHGCSPQETLVMKENELAERAQILYDADECDEAIKCLGEAIAKNGSNAELYTLRGKCYSAMEKMDKAMADWKEAVTLSVKEKQYDNESWGILVGAIVYLGQNMDVTEVEGVDLDDIAKMADKLCSHEEFNTGLYAFRAVIEKSPKEGRFYKQRGYCYKRMGLVEEANADFYEAKKLMAY